MQPRVVVVVLLALAGVLPLAVTAIPARAAHQARMWEPVPTADWIVMVRSIERPNAPLPGLPGSYAIVVVDLTNNSDRVLAPDAANFTLWSGGRPSLNLSAVDAAVDYALAGDWTPFGAVVAPGQAITTLLIFPISPRAGRLTLHLSSGETIRLDECKCNLPSPVRVVSR